MYFLRDYTYSKIKLPCWYPKSTNKEAACCLHSASQRKTCR